LIRKGLTFHGLRKSLGKRAADAGFSENDIAAALGQANPAKCPALHDRGVTQPRRAEPGLA
jgi:integrase